MDGYLDPIRDGYGIHILEVGVNKYVLRSFDWMPTGDVRQGM